MHGAVHHAAPQPAVRKRELNRTLGQALVEAAAGHSYCMAAFRVLSAPDARDNLWFLCAPPGISNISLCVPLQKSRFPEVCTYRGSETQRCLRVFAIFTAAFPSQCHCSRFARESRIAEKIAALGDAHICMYFPPPPACVRVLARKTVLCFFPEVGESDSTFASQGGPCSGQLAPGHRAAQVCVIRRCRNWTEGQRAAWRDMHSSLLADGW